jgi:hypothetical protein
MYACAFSHPEFTSLMDGPLENVFAFLPPAISLSGTVIGYATNGCPFGPDDGRSRCGTGVTAEDLTNGQILQGRSAGPRDNALVKVGSLQVNKRGSLAWITCPERGDRHDAFGKRSPNCVRSGDLDSVWRLDIGERDPELLDRGRSIDPSSLRRSGPRITWLHGGKRRSARLG